MGDDYIEITEGFSEYVCPNCGKVIAYGVVFHLNAVCPDCNKLIVIVGLGQEKNA